MKIEFHISLDCTGTRFLISEKLLADLIANRIEKLSEAHSTGKIPRATVVPQRLVKTEALEP